MERGETMVRQQPGSGIETNDRPLGVAIVGTGFAAHRRAEAIQADPHLWLRAVAGHGQGAIADFVARYGGEGVCHWSELLGRSDVDLIFVCNVNQLHGAIARGALEAGKHVVVEYPLALSYQEGVALAELAENRRCLLHVEHIELLGGLHQTLKRLLPQIGPPSYCRYITLAPKRQPGSHWTFNHELYGFPLVGALSRIHRLTDLFGSVAAVSGQSQFWPSDDPDYHRGCLVSAQLEFTQGFRGEVVYGKGEPFRQGDRRFTIHGPGGQLEFGVKSGQLIQGDRIEEITLPSRRGLFQQDTAAVRDYLLGRSDSLYVSLGDSLSALKVAENIQRAAHQGRRISL